VNEEFVEPPNVHEEFVEPPNVHEEFVEPPNVHDEFVEPPNVHDEFVERHVCIQGIDVTTSTDEVGGRFGDVETEFDRVDDWAFEAQVAALARDGALLDY
jgi:hypothetical protein